MDNKSIQQQDSLSPQEQEALKQSRLIWEMSEQEGFKTLFRPFLMDKLNQSFPDPSQFKSDQDYLYAAKTTSIFKKVVAELLQWIDGNVEQAKFLEKKQKGENKDNFELGG